MNLLIVAATRFEIEPFLKKNNSPEILITGVGIPATIFHVTKKIIEKKFDYVIQAGIGGTFTDSLNLADVVAIKQDTFGDLGIDESGNFSDLFEVGFLDKNDFPFSDGWLVNPNSLNEKIKLTKARSVTINKITDDPQQLKKLKQKYMPEVESMEGAAFHYVCLQQKINFLQLRGISNKVGERDKKNWQIKNAIENLNKELLEIIKNLS